MNAFVDGFVDVDGVRLHYVEAGAGPLVVFHHGFPSCWRSFQHQMEALCHDHRVVGVDGLGANRSDKPTELSPYRLERLVRQLDLLTRELAGDERFSLVGHDWGGALAWAYAQHLPDRLQELVVLSAPPPNQLLTLLATDHDQRSRSSYMYDMREGVLHEQLTTDGGRRMWRFAYEPLRALEHYTEAMDEEFRRALAQPGAIDGGINWYRANVPLPDEITDDHHWPSTDASTDVPALLIWGDDDQTFVPGFIDGLPRYASNLTVHRMAGTGHWPMLEHPDRVSELIGDFVAEPGRWS